MKEWFFALILVSCWQKSHFLLTSNLLFFLVDIHYNFSLVSGGIFHVLIFLYLISYYVLLIFHNNIQPYYFFYILSYFLSLIPCCVAYIFLVDIPSKAGNVIPLSLFHLSKLSSLNFLESSVYTTFIFSLCLIVSYIYIYTQWYSLHNVIL